MRIRKFRYTTRFKVILILFTVETLICLYLFLTDFIYSENRHPNIEVYAGCTKRISSIVESVYTDTGWKELKGTNCADSEVYYIVKDVFKTSKMTEVWMKNDGVTIVTQTTPNNLAALDILFNRWSGPISVSIFLCVKDIKTVLESLVKYRDAKVCFHFVAIDLNQRSSSMCETMMKPKVGFINPREERVPYPFNVLRNVALSAVRTGYVLMMDIDMLPSMNLHDDFLNHIDTISEKQKLSTSISRYIVPKVYMLKYRTAYVIPSFETLSSFYLPKNKLELLPLVTEGFIRPYAYESCKHCQRNTNYSKWLSNPGHGAYMIPMSPFHYEPFFILHISSYPRFEELFKDRGLNRISQVCETYMSGVNFSVLNSGFLLHRGFRPRRLADYEKKNYHIYNNMKKTLKLKYDTNRECDVRTNSSRIKTRTSKLAKVDPK